VSRQPEAAGVAGGTLRTGRFTDMTSRREQFQTDAQGRRTAVVLPIAEYEQMLEDLHDLAVVAERRDEPTVTFDELQGRLAEGGAV
jgi:hypothetical protein